MRVFVVPEVLVVQEDPSEEVSMIPLSPTAAYDGLDVVVLLSSLLFLAQEMTVRVKRDMRIMYKNLFIFLITSNERK